MNRLLKYFYILITFLFIGYSTAPGVLASEALNQSGDGQASNQIQANSQNQDTQTGPIEPVGPQQPTGNILPTGPIESTGSAEQVGPIEPTGPQPVHNDQESLVNSQTGPNSENSNSSGTVSSTNLNEVNNSSINNNAQINLSSGANNVQSNTSVGEVKTGDISGSLTFLNITNSNLSSDSSVGVKSLNGTSNDLYLLPISNRDLINSLTGPQSQNTNQLDNNNFISVYDENNSEINNDLMINANTGDNTILNNTSVGKIKTGEIKIALNTLNLANLTGPQKTLYLDIFSILGNLSGDIVVPSTFVSEKTGPESQNMNSAVNNSQKDIKINNQSNVINDIKLSAETGNNTISSNSTVGDIKTGVSSIKNSVINTVNAGIPILYVVNLFGQWLAPAEKLPDNVAINQITGPDSTNLNESQGQTDISINQNNIALVNNDITIEANTGGNQIINNTKVSSLETGSVNVYNNVVNAVNSFSDQFDQFYIVILNIFGDWSGNFKTDKQKTTEQAAEVNKPENPQKNIPVKNDKDSTKTEIVISDEPNEIAVDQNSTETVLVISDSSDNNAKVKQSSIAIKDVYLKTTTEESNNLENTNDTSSDKEDENNGDRNNLPLSLLLIPALAMFGAWSVYEGINYLRSKKNK